MDRDQAQKIAAACHRNGGPLALKAAAGINWCLRQIPEQKKGELHPLHQRLILIFQSRINKPIRDPKEHRAWAKIAPHITPTDVEILERFYRLPKSRNADATWSRKTGILQLLNQYISQIEIATTHLDKIGQLTPPTPKADKYPEPQNWQARAPGNLGQRSWHLVRTQYPDIAEQLQAPLTDLSKGIN